MRSGAGREVLRMTRRSPAGSARAPAGADAGLEQVYEDYAMALTLAFVETRSTT